MTEKTDAQLIEDLKDSLKAFFEDATNKNGYAVARRYRISDRLQAIFNHIQQDLTKLRNQTFQSVTNAMTTLPVYTGSTAQEMEVVKALIENVPEFRNLGNPWRSLDSENKPNFL